MNDQEVWTIQRLLSWTADFFQRNGSDSPRLDAEILLGETLGCKRIELYTQFDRVPDPQQLAAFRGLVKRRVAGEPVAYLVSRKEFYSLPFRVTPDVLIPRPETEQLVVEVLDGVRAHAQWRQPRIVDIGTGSGIIAATLAKHLPQAQLFASDVSPAALEVARENARSLGVAERIEFRSGNLLEPWSDSAQFHVIVSNLPYIGLAEQPQIDKSVVDYEPHLALFSTGPRGFEIIEQLAAAAPERLVAGGLLALEISPLISQEVQRILRSGVAWTDVAVRRDLAGHDRIVLAQTLGGDKG